MPTEPELVVLAACAERLAGARCGPPARVVPRYGGHGVTACSCQGWLIQSTASTIGVRRRCGCVRVRYSCQLPKPSAGSPSSSARIGAGARERTMLSFGGAHLEANLSMSRTRSVIAGGTVAVGTSTHTDG